jgi:hypothetical protein
MVCLQNLLGFMADNCISQKKIMIYSKTIMNEIYADARAIIDRSGGDTGPLTGLFAQSPALYCHEPPYGTEWEQ